MHRTALQEFVEFFCTIRESEFLPQVLEGSSEHLLLPLLSSLGRATFISQENTVGEKRKPRPFLLLLRMYVRSLRVSVEGEAKTNNTDGAPNFSQADSAQNCFFFSPVPSFLGPLSPNWHSASANGRTAEGGRAMTRGGRGGAGRTDEGRRRTNGALAFCLPFPLQALSSAFPALRRRRRRAGKLPPGCKGGERRRREERGRSDPVGLSVGRWTDARTPHNTSQARKS